LIIVVIGVSASGKSTLGEALAAALGWEFIEGDAFHPPENVARMRASLPLSDADRAPWLAELNRQILQADEAGRDVVLACSALKKVYRDALRDGVCAIRFVYLWGDPEMIRARLHARKGHFMPTILLDSQIATLEPPKDALPVPIDLPTDEQVAMVRQAFDLESPE